MTHSLHRIGSAESLKNDYVLLVTPAVGINAINSGPKLCAILDIIADIPPNNIGSYETGTTFTGVNIEEIKKSMHETPRIRCCYDSKDKIHVVLKRIKELDTGLSVVVSGLNDEVLEMAKIFEIEPHSVNYSLGVFGKTELLPDEEIMEITSMCGHDMISQDLVVKMIKLIQSGDITSKEAAREIAMPCICGIFNVHRATDLLTKYESTNKQMVDF